MDRPDLYASRLDFDKANGLLIAMCQMPEQRPAGDEIQERRLAFPGNRRLEPAKLA